MDEIITIQNDNDTVTLPVADIPRFMKITCRDDVEIIDGNEKHRLVRGVTFTKRVYRLPFGIFFQYVRCGWKIYFSIDRVITYKTSPSKS